MGTKFRGVKILLVVSLIACLLLSFLFVANAEQPANVLKNGDFETIGSDNKSDSWGIDCWKGDAFVGITDQKAHSGKYAGFLQFGNSNDGRLVQTVPVESGTVYRFSGWIATQGVTRGKLGANLCVMGDFTRSSGVKEDSDWQYQEIIFRTCDNQTEVTFGARLGFWGETVKGTAFFDDIKLEKVTDPTVPFQQLTENDIPKPSDHPLERPGIAQPKPPEPKTIVSGAAKYLGFPTWIILFYLVLLLGISLRSKELDGSTLGEEKYKKLISKFTLIFFAAALVNFIIRIPLFSAVPIGNDIGSYKAWIFRMMDLGPSKFYARVCVFVRNEATTKITASSGFFFTMK